MSAQVTRALRDRAAKLDERRKALAADADPLISQGPLPLVMKFLADEFRALADEAQAQPTGHHAVLP